MKFKTNKQKFLILALLILSGEFIYFLPYVLSRVFRPTFLDVFQLNNFQLGSLFSVYGIVALLSYIYGGVITDRYSPRKLMSSALFLTALGGLVLASYPSYQTLQILYGYWGFTSVFLFWGAMIKATRLWGGNKNQGKAFGFLDGGRGIVAASMGSIGVFIFSLILTTEIESSSVIERQEAFKYVILFSSFMVAFIGLLVFIFLRNNEDRSTNTKSSLNSLINIKHVLQNQSIWLLMIIIMCAYVGYKVTDIYSLYASDVMLYDQIDAAEVGAVQLYLRPVVCIVIGLLADKTKNIFWIIFGFIIMLIGALIFSSGLIKPDMNFIFFFSLIVLAVGTYSIRALYFAVLKEANVPFALTGTAVGLISVVGYSPDIFAGPIMGYLLDTYPGIVGHQYVYLMLVVFSVIGLMASLRFARLTKKTP
ncbi:MFS transporter [Flavobacteriaceae bacterium]|nr:MFS transporter [Flavobacteriaceae bacterium]MDB4240218.1 MFS transporter [Flavobacteriaceae bacterium]MDB9788026.1 MFS transporter [Flavobacteriaceae bacterium]MDB9901805.1 MFS transporter [Flavobacteriaceae bacterium]MDC0958524.1 MFS transporter [Flavobacteriaceae bacterium]